MRYSRLGEETCRFPRTRTSGYGLYRMCEDTPAFRPERKEWFPFGYYCQYGSSGSAFEPDAEFRSCKLEFIDDEAANRLLDQPMRAPWNI